MQGVANTIKCYSGQTFEGPDGVNDWSFGKNIEEKECENGVTQCLKIGANIMGGKLLKSGNQSHVLLLAIELDLVLLFTLIYFHFKPEGVLQGKRCFIYSFIIFFASKI